MQTSIEAEGAVLECSSLPEYVFVGKEYELHVTALTVLDGAVVERNDQPSMCFLQVVATSADTNLPLMTGRTNLFVPVTNKIVIAEEHSERYEFFKDIGGKDKGIELTVSLADANNSPVTTRSLAITPVLLYEDGSVVADQTILQTSDDVSSMHIPEGMFSAPNLKFRIAQVSSKHGGRAFRIRMQPNLLLSPGAADVMPGLSVPVEVKSKIKRPASHSNSAERYAEAQPPKRLRQDTLRGGDDGFSASSLLSPEGITDFSNSVLALQAWCTEVAFTLDNKVRWKPLGYSAVEGQRDKTLLYDLQNPNEHVQRLLQTYSERVVHAMQHLMHVQRLLLSDGQAQHEDISDDGQEFSHARMNNHRGDLHLSLSDLPHEAIHALNGMRGQHGGYASARAHESQPSSSTSR
eukprot:gene40803-49764_t